MAQIPATEAIEGITYKIGKELGKGFHGHVRIGTSEGKNHKLEVALKFIPVQDDNGQKEINILKKLRHPNIVPLQTHTKTNDFFILVLPLARENLTEFIGRQRKLKEPALVKIIRQILDGLVYIHSKQIYHHDLKTDNILVMDPDNTIVITDLGEAYDAILSSTLAKENEKRDLERFKSVIRDLSKGAPRQSCQQFIDAIGTKNFETAAKVAKHPYIA